MTFALRQSGSLILRLQRPWNAPRPMAFENRAFSDVWYRAPSRIIPHPPGQNNGSSDFHNRRCPVSPSSGTPLRLGTGCQQSTLGSLPYPAVPSRPVVHPLPRTAESSGLPCRLSPPSRVRGPFSTVTASPSRPDRCLELDPRARVHWPSCCLLCSPRSPPP